MCPVPGAKNRELEGERRGEGGWGCRFVGAPARRGEDAGSVSGVTVSTGLPAVDSGGFVTVKFKEEGLEWFTRKEYGHERSTERQICRGQEKDSI